MANLRTVAALTTAYVACTPIRCGNAPFVSFGFDLSWSSSTSVEWYYGWSDTQTGTYRTETNTATTGASTTHAVASNTLAVTASVSWEDKIRTKNAWCTVYVKRTGGSASDVLAVTGELGA
jgi:hypothetical protein